MSRSIMPALKEPVILILAAIAPAIAMLVYIYKTDKHEKEPVSLIRKLVLAGVISCLPAILLEVVSQDIFLPYAPINSPVVYLVIVAILTGLVEEACKFYFMKRNTWHNADFNYRYDGVVYAVAVSLGFAAFENIFYVLQYGLATAGLRALLAIPGHMSFAVVMGVFYGRAKIADVWGDDKGARRNLIYGYLAATALHSFYDATALVGTETAMTLFVIFIILMYIGIYRLIRKESRSDEPIF